MAQSKREKAIHASRKKKNTFNSDSIGDKWMEYFSNNRKLTPEKTSGVRCDRCKGSGIIIDYVPNGKFVPIRFSNNSGFKLYKDGKKYRNLCNKCSGTGRVDWKKI